MTLNVHQEVAALQRLGATQLRARYAEVYSPLMLVAGFTNVLGRVL